MQALHALISFLPSEEEIQSSSYCMDSARGWTLKHLEEFV